MKFSPRHIRSDLFWRHDTYMGYWLRSSENLFGVRRAGCVYANKVRAQWMDFSVYMWTIAMTEI